MPKYIGLNKILVIGSGPILIGQGCEFDYAGTQACQALIEEDCKVYKPNGELLLIFRKKVIPPGLCHLAFPALRKAARKSNNRGNAAGEVPEEIEDRMGNYIRKVLRITKKNGKPLKRGKPLKLDGTVSNTSYAQEVLSGIIGYYDRNTRFPYCRTTAYNLHHPELFLQALPYIQAVDRVFAENVPERYEAQLNKVKQTPEDFVIHRTAFTTVTVNKNWRTAIHKDKGDLKEGFGVMSVLGAGKYKGCYLCFPKYRIAVDMRTQDVLMADVHEWHGNTPFVGVEGMYERISCVLYMRGKMTECLPVEDETERAKRRKRGDPVN